MSSTVRFLLALSLACPTGSSDASDLLVGFAVDVPLRIGDPSTLIATTGPAVGVVTGACASGESFFVATAGLVRRVDPSSGAILSAFSSPHSVSSLAAGAEGLLLAGPGGEVTIVDPASGAVVRASSLGKAVLGVTGAGGRVYVSTSDQEIWSAAEADLAWTLEASSLPPGAGALVARGSALLLGTPGHVFVIERDSGALIYGYNVPNDAVALALQGNDVIVAGSDGSVVRVDPDTAAIGASAAFGDGATPTSVSALAVYDAKPFASLKGDADTASISQPQPVSLQLEVADAIGGLMYLVLGSATGTEPGIMVGGVHLPLNPDAYLTLTASGSPLLLGGFGSFSDANALGLFRADAAFALPPGLPPSFAGIVLNHAFVVFDPVTGVSVAASNASSLGLGP